MSNAEYFVKASKWGRDHFTCDFLDKDRCGRPIRRILVKEGEPMAGYCYPHYLAAKRGTTQANPSEKGK